MVYWFDGEDRIVKADADWQRGADANDAPDLTVAAVKQQHLSDFISDPTSIHLWEILLRRTRDEGRLSVSIRCDAPDARRVLRLALARDGGLVRVTAHVVAESVQLLDPRDPFCWGIGAAPEAPRS